MFNGLTFKTKLAAAVVALATVASGSLAAEARDGRNAAAAAGVIGGLAAGAAIGAATQPRYYEPAPAYPAYGPRYHRRVIVDEGDDCFVRTSRYVANGVEHVRRRTVCR
jgi:hypothetical protein